MAQIPLWKDIEYLSAGTPQTTFTVYANSQEIYRGVAVKPESSYSLQIKFNDIFADYFAKRELQFPVSSTTITASETGMGAQLFSVSFSHTDTQTTFDVVADFSYQAFRNIAADPIRLLIDRRQKFTVTHWRKDVTTNITRISSTGVSSSISSRTGARTIGYMLRNTSNDISQIKVDDGTFSLLYEVKDTCADFVIHYINARGGWDSLVMLGRCSVKEDYTRHSVGKTSSSVASTDVSNGNQIGTAIAANEVAKKWTLRTGLLTDDESSRMYHLLGTTRAILEDLNTGEVFPVNITNSSYEEQTFRGNGNKMAQYEINVELAQQRVRR